MPSIITLTKGYEALVDDEDFEWLSQHKWRMNERTGYAICSMRKDIYRTVSMHREILSKSSIGLPIGLLVDHIDFNKLNNCKANLRFVTKAQNNRYVGKRKNNTSGYKGVRWCKKGKRWRSEITVNWEHKWLGYFDTVEEAATAYNEAAKEYFGEFACLNLIKSPSVC